MVRAIAGTGTSERQWEAWPAPLAWSSLPIGDIVAPIVVAPHPDDEILGVGGLLAMLPAPAEVVVVTAGEASHPRSRVHSREDLAAIRRAETDAACAVLGVDGSRVHHLRHADGGIDEAVLTDQLRARLGPDRWCFTTWRGDGHPDHERVGRAAAAACAERGALLLEFPVWTWHWAAPGDPDVPWDRARRIDLTGAARAAKQRAIEEFHSQIRPLGPAAGDAAILPPEVLARFARPYETVFVQ